MKLVFFTQDSEIEALIDDISGLDVVMTDSLEGLEEAIEDERCLFFIDFDYDKKYAEQVNQQLFEHGNVRRVIISSGMRVKDLKKHQKGKHSAHGYLVKPLSLEIINGVLNDYELSDYIFDHQLEESEVDLDEVPLTDIGGKTPAIKEFVIASDVRAEMQKHSAQAGEPDLDSTVNITIQAKFDDVFGDENNHDDEGDDSLPAFNVGADGISDIPDEVDDIPTLQVDFGGGEDLTAGFKAGLSPEDGTGEFEIDASELEKVSVDEDTEEVAMAGNDDDEIELDDASLEFDNDDELEEGALEFDSSDDEDLDLSGGDGGGDAELDDNEVSISLGADDLDLGDDLELGDDVEIDLSATDSDSDNEAGGDLEFDEATDDSLQLGAEDDSADDGLDLADEVELDDDSLDLDENTNPTMVAETGAIDLNDDDIAEFSAQSASDGATATASELDLGSEVQEDGFSLGDEAVEEDELDFGVGDEFEEATAATTVAAAGLETADDLEDSLGFGNDDDIEEEETQVTEIASERSFESPLPHGQVLESLGQPELLRLQATIKQLREERGSLLSQLDDLKGSVRLSEQDKLTLKAELEEARIEINILKKRHSEENEEARHRTRLLEERKAFFEEKARTLQKEFDRLSQKVRIDFNKVKQREKELESQLELVTMDSQSQVKSRDMKILELKRKIDSLEFNMENATIREQKSREDKVRLEERLGKMMKTLRGSIKILEDDIDLDDETRIQLEKARKL